MLNRMPAFVSGLPLPSKSIFSTFDSIHASGNSTAEQQKVIRFFVSIGISVRCTAQIIAQMRIDVRMKCKPFFCLRAQSLISSLSSIQNSF